MSETLPLNNLITAQHLWRGRPSARPVGREPTGINALDDALPMGGWPEHALTEILLPAPGMGEIDLLLPTLRRLTQASQHVVLIAPPCIPYAPAWQARGVDLRHLTLITAEPKPALWAFEQCLRSGSCQAVIGWPERIDHPALRRLQVAADTGHALGFAVRPSRQAEQASPAALRLEIIADRTLRVRKCRGGAVPTQSFLLDRLH